jgi:hypothetical protein
MKMVVIHSIHSFISLVENGKALRLALLLEQRAVGDIAGLRGDVERAVELVEARLVDQVELVGGGPACGAQEKVAR